MLRYLALKDQCLKAITYHSESIILHFVAKVAAKYIHLKLANYIFVLWSSMATLEEILDPRISNASVTDNKKDDLCGIFIDKYVFKASTEEKSVRNEHPSDLSLFLNTVRSARKEATLFRDEVYASFELTMSEDPSNTDLLIW